MNKKAIDYRGALILAAAVASLDAAARRELRISGQWITTAARRMRPWRPLPRVSQILTT